MKKNSDKITVDEIIDSNEEKFDSEYYENQEQKPKKTKTKRSSNTSEYDNWNDFIDSVKKDDVFISKKIECTVIDVPNGRCYIEYMHPTKGHLVVHKSKFDLLPVRIK